MRLLVLAFAACLLTIPAMADTLRVTVVDKAGAPVSNAVIIGSEPAPASEPLSFSWANEMAQADIQFTPYILVAPVNSEVSFPNRDRVRHHVYSFAKGNKFELKLYGKDETRFVTFKNTGAVAVGCNIHDGMIGYIRVVDTAQIGRTNELGVAELDGTFDSDTKITVWHPDVNRGKDLIVEVPKDATDLQVVLGASSKKPGQSHH